MLYHAHTPDEVLESLRSTKHGLHQIYAEGRIKRYGRNNIRLVRRSGLKRFYEPFVHIFSLALLTSTLVSVLLGEYTMSGILLATVFIYVGMRYLQDYSLEYAMRRTERQAVSKTTVLRDGITASIDPNLVVPGDIVVLEKGDRIPADGRVIRARSLLVNQIHLTGSSTPIAKNTKTLHSNTPLEAQTNMVFRGSYVASGYAQYIVTATGNNTQYGQLHSSLVKAETTGHLQEKISRLLARMILFALTATLIVGVFGVVRGVAPEEILQYCMAILIAAVPQSLPVVIGIVIAVGLRQMTKHSALMTSVRTIEATSVASALVSDKTGMLTHDKLIVKEIWQPEDSPLSPAELCDRVFLRGDSDTHDGALVAYLKRQKHKITTYAPANSYSFTREIGMSGNLWHNGKSYQLHIKGTPEKILNRSSLTSAEYEAAEKQLHQLASQGYHILALAHTELPSPITKLTSLPKRHQLQFDGFIALQDHIRPEVRTSIAQATQAGVATYIVTGDHVETAYRFGRRLGLVSFRSQVFDSRKLDVVTDAQLARICRDVVIFARVSPNNKQRILRALKHRHIVMMTGDSVDDVPVLLGAQVGIASSRGSRIAREASDLLLLNDRFATILEAVRHSRTIMGNIRRMVFYVLIIGLSELAIVIGSLAVGVPIALLPAQLLWINLVVVSSILLPLGLEPHSRHIMRRKPVSPHAPILPRYLVVRAVAIAAAMAGTIVLLFADVYQHTGVDYARSLVFVTLITMLLVSALIARSDHTSTLVRFRTWSPLVYLAILLLILIHLLLFATPLRDSLELTSLAPRDLLFTLIVGIAIPLVVAEVSKLYSRHAIRKKGRSYE